MTDEELCRSLTGRLQDAICKDGWEPWESWKAFGTYQTPQWRQLPGEREANSTIVRFKCPSLFGVDFDICIWASDLHLHVFVNGACVLHAGVDSLGADAGVLWNAVRTIRDGGAVPDAARAREQLVEALSGGAA